MDFKTFTIISNKKYPSGTLNQMFTFEYCQKVAFRLLSSLKWKVRKDEASTSEMTQLKAFGFS